MADEQSSVPYALVVDDAPMVLMHAADIIEDAGFRVLTAYNANDALGQLIEHDGEVDLLFTDVEMPGPINGFELARMTAQRWPAVGILVASGHLKPKVGDLPAGAHFVSKPFAADVIYDRLHQLLPDGRKPEPLKQKM